MILKEPMGDWFLTVAAGLEYMYHRQTPLQRPPSMKTTTKTTKTTDHEARDDDHRRTTDDDDDQRRQAREEAGADWMVEQGFDRKD